MQLLGRSEWLPFLCSVARSLLCSCSGVLAGCQVVAMQFWMVAKMLLCSVYGVLGSQVVVMQFWVVARPLL